MKWLGVMLALLPLLAVQAQEAGGLNILIIEGDGAINNIKQRTARETIVQVQDENHKPVAGAIVAFTTPNQGASGVFADGSHLFTTTTDNAGRASMRGLRLNGNAGRMDIRVTASHQGKTGSLVISQTNVLAAAAGGIAGLSLAAKVLLAVGIAGAAAAAGTIAATRGGGPSTPAATSPTTISIGAPGTVGPPK